MTPDDSEQAHCEQVVFRMLKGDEDAVAILGEERANSFVAGKLTSQKEMAEELVMWRTRANDLANRIDPRMGWPTTEERLREKLAKAEGEIERLREQYTEACAAATVRAGVLQAEIERLKCEYAQAAVREEHRARDLTTKLTNLSAAAERWRDELYRISEVRASAVYDAFVQEIEAGRKRESNE